MGTHRCAGSVTGMSTAQTIAAATKKTARRSIS
jgi:hypothetical protein